MDDIYCNNCGQQLLAEPSGVPRQPCPNCGSTSRKFTKHLESTIEFSSHVMAATFRNDQPIGFTESERPELTRYASLTPEGAIHLNLRGLAPRNEQDSDTVCATLVNALNASGQQAALKGRGEQDEDCVVTVNNVRIGVQVVRALTDPHFWIGLARRGEVSELKLTIPEAASALRAAIEHKKAIPPIQRPGLILALDAYRLPALALEPVTDHFKREHEEWTRSLGFYAVYVIGPMATFVSRLDE